jgi:putative membrane protein
VRTAGALGVAVLTAVWLLPLETIAPPFAAHMLRHMGLVAVAAPLLALGLPRAFAPLAISPLAAAVVEFVVVWAWHLPAMHAAARLSDRAFLAEQASFLAAGLLVWVGALGARQPLAGAGGLLLTSMHMTLLGAILVLAPRDLYAALCGTVPDLTGQQLGGLLMLGIGTPVYLAGGLWLVRRALGQEARA